MLNLCLRLIRRQGRHPFCTGLLASFTGLSFLFLCSCVGSARLPDARPDQHATATGPAVKVTPERDGQATHFWAENSELCEVTMTFEMGLVNLKGDVQFPYTVAVPARRKVELFTLSPSVPGTNWEFNYTNNYKLGSYCITPEDYVYRLPYAPGSKRKVTQAANGSFSHKGSNKYAIDWKMPKGTPVFAARGGLVVKTKDDSDTGGPDMSFDRYNNYVLVRHSDGTLGHYCHLLKGSCLVKPGQTIVSGQIIARSGNTGFSSGPHLHFCVFRTINGKVRESIPIKFQTADEPVVTLVGGRSYRAPEVQSARAPASTRLAAKNLPVLR